MENVWQVLNKFWQLAKYVEANLEFRGKFDSGAVQKCEQVVGLEKCSTVSIVLQNRFRFRREGARQRVLQPLYVLQIQHDIDSLFTVSYTL